MSQHKILLQILMVAIRKLKLRYPVIKSTMLMYTIYYKQALGFVST